MICIEQNPDLENGLTDVIAFETLYPIILIWLFVLKQFSLADNLVDDETFILHSYRYSDYQTTKLKDKKWIWTVN
jgi:hypothetical protein